MVQSRPEEECNAGSLIEWLMNPSDYDAIVVGAGPNGLSAAIELARAGLAVGLLEAKGTIGGGARSSELTLPGYVHDICSAIHPMAVISPFFRSLPIEQHGVEWVHPPASLAHPFEDGSAALLFRSVDETGQTLGADQKAYRNLMSPLVANADIIFNEILRPVRFPGRPFAMLHFGMNAVRSAAGLAASRFKEHRAKGLFAGCAAHSMLPLQKPGSGAIGLALLLASHLAGWPFARGGSQKIADSLAAHLTNLGGEIQLEHPVDSIRDLPMPRCVLFDLTPRQVVSIANEQLPSSYSRKLSRFRYGPGSFKVDWALNGPIPWKAAECLLAATVHVGGRMEEIMASEDAAWNGRHSERPFVLVAQHTLFDSTRAPAGKHTGWAYCHVPHGSSMDMTEKIEMQIERFAPGFRDLIIARHTYSAIELERHNPNLIGGDIGGGANDLWQFIARPVLRFDPYATPNRSLYICSSSTPPGGGIHGMCGYWAARSALRGVF